MGELVLILIVLGLVALTIIGFFTVVSWFFGLFSGNPAPQPTRFQPPPPTSPIRRCAECGATQQPEDLFCMVCGKEQPAASPAELSSARHVLRRLLNAKRIDVNTFQQVWQALDVEAGRVSAPAAPTTEAVAAKHQPEVLPVPIGSAQQTLATLVSPVTEVQPRPATPPPASQAAPTYPTPEPRRSFTEMLTSFMEESSIRWGELIGGLVVIGSALALVVNLWSQIAERPMLKFGVFMTLIAGLFGLGFYSAHRWRLPTTSRGVLLTATLLVPLNFLAIAAFGRTTTATAVILLAETLSWLVLAVLVWLATRVIAAEQQRWLTVGTLWASLALLLAKHLAPAGLNWRSWLLLGALPVLGYLVSVGAAVREVRRRDEVAAPQAYGLFTVLGVNLFAALLPLALLQVRAADWTRALRENAPLVALLGLPAMALSWLLWRRLHTSTLARERTIAASLGLSGAALLVGSAVLAFPLVDSLLVIALLNTAVFGWAAWRYELRPARWLALAQTIWAYWLLALLALGRLSLGMEDARRLFAAVLSNTSGILLLIAFAVLFGLAEWWRKQATSTEKYIVRAQDFSGAAGLVGLCSLILLTWHGFGLAGDPKRLAWSWGFYAVAAFVWAWRRATLPMIWLGWLLLLGVSAQTCVYKYGWPQGWPHAWIVCWLALAVAASVASLASIGRSEKARQFWCKPALQVAVISAAWASVAMWVRSRGLNPWYLAPLLLVAATSVVYAWRYAAQRAAIAGGLFCNAAASLAYVIRAGQFDSWFETHELARLAQINLLTSGVYALSWLLARRRGEAPLPRWLRWQVRVLAGLAFALLLAVALRLSLAPMWPSAVALTLGDWLGWLVFAVLATCIWNTRTTRVTVLRFHKLVLALLAFGILLACTLHRFEQANWLSYHTLLAACVVIAWVMLWAVLWAARGATVDPANVLGRWLNSLLNVGVPRIASAATFWANLLSVVAVWLSLRGFGAPGGPWRGVLALAGVAALQIGLALAQRNGIYFYSAGLLTCVALTEWIFGYSKGTGSLLDVALLNVTALAAVALLSLWLDLKVLRAAANAQNSVPAFHQFAASLLMALTCLKVALGLALDFSGEPPLPTQGWIAGLALVAVIVLCLACVWDALFVSRFVLLFVTGLALVAALVDQQNLSAQPLLVAGTLVLTGYALLVSVLWGQRAKLSAFLQALRVPDVTAALESHPVWFIRAQSALAAGAVGLALLASVQVINWPQRWLAASVALFAPLAVGLLTRMAEGLSADIADVASSQQENFRLPTFRSRWQMVALVLELGALSAWLWTALNLQGPYQNPNRAIALLTMLLGLALAFFGARAAAAVNWSQTFDSWEKAVRHVLFSAGLIGLGLLALMLVFEWERFTALGFVPLGWWAKAALTAVIVAVCVLSVAFALWQGSDPFELRAVQRGRYVYAAEVFAVLLLAHLRLSAPWLFGGLFKQYWPLMVLALAFAGVGVAEQLRRRGRVVLAEPLARTGVFLPLLPSLGFWLLESRVDYAGLLLLVGLFYGVLSVWRRSFGFGLLAALAANGGWWHWLQRTEDYGFLAHPQVWLIPAALSVLAAAHINREQLSREQMAAFRYAALITIYVSSTADIFINGVATSPWLPLVLAVLSVAGVLLGMLLHVRAYLFLGTAFLLLAVITMVWHAALSLGWGWLWYVSGIAFGVFILYLFAMFERRRAEFIGLMERLKTWEA